MNPYDDIIHLSRPASRHPKMPLVQRAKIFCPYDALRGFDEAIEDVDRTAGETVREGRSEELQEGLSRRLAALKRGMRVTVLAFRPGEKPGKGTYRTITGTVRGVDEAYRLLEIEPDDERTDEAGRIGRHPPLAIPFDDLYGLSGKKEGQPLEAPCASR